MSAFVKLEQEICCRLNYKKADMPKACPPNRSISRLFFYPAANGVGRAQTLQPAVQCTFLQRGKWKNYAAICERTSTLKLSPFETIFAVIFSAGM